MGQFSVEKPVAPGSVLSGNQQIRLILGHSTLATSEKYYIHAKGIEAAHRYHATLARKRKSLARELRDEAD